MGNRSRGTGSLRLPAFFTTAMTITRCVRCEGTPTVLASVIAGFDHRMDPLPLSIDGLAAAVAGGRRVVVVSPYSLLAHRAKPGHWWLTPPGGGPPTLLAEHAHGQAPLPHDPELAKAFLPRLMPPDARPINPNEPPPF